VPKVQVDTNKRKIKSRQGTALNFYDEIFLSSVSCRSLFVSIIFPFLKTVKQIFGKLKGQKIP
jgi:hypothetical protein